MSMRGVEIAVLVCRIIPLDYYALLGLPERMHSEGLTTGRFCHRCLFLPALIVPIQVHHLFPIIL